MAQVARAADASLDASTGMLAPQVPDLIAGENIDPAAPCHIRRADGRVYMSTGAQAGAAATAAELEAARFLGFSAKAARAGRPVTLFNAGARFRYATGGLAINQKYFIDTAKGRLNDAATTLGTTAVAMAVNATDVVIVANPY